MNTKQIEFLKILNANNIYVLNSMQNAQKKILLIEMLYLWLWFSLLAFLQQDVWKVDRNSFLNSNLHSLMWKFKFSEITKCLKAKKE